MFRLSLTAALLAITRPTTAASLSNQPASVIELQRYAGQ